MKLTRWLQRVWRRASGGSTARELTPQAAIGRWGEHEAEKFLKRAGFKLLGRRVRPNRRDEIDLVMRRGRVIAFIEVKTRSSERYGRPATAIDRRKRHALRRAAAAWLRRAKYPAAAYRFDVVEVISEPESEQPTIRHLENAFPFNRRFPV